MRRTRAGNSLTAAGWGLLAALSVCGSVYSQGPGLPTLPLPQPSRGAPPPGLVRQTPPAPSNTGPAVGGRYSARDTAMAGGDDTSRRLKFSNAPVEMLLDEYSEVTGLTLLLSPSLPKATVTLRSQGTLSIDEYLQAIQEVLAMNGITLLREGTTFLRVVPIAKAREEGMSIEEYQEGMALPELGGLISQMIPLKHIELQEIRPVLEPFKHSAFGTIHEFPNINSMLVTDSPANINRIMQLIQYIDQPIEAREEPIIVQIRYAKASDIKAKLEQILDDAKGEDKKSTVPRQKTSGAPGAEASAATPPGVIRARRAAAAAGGKGNEPVLEEIERGILRGDVKIIEDDRTNILIIITRPENMPFFDKIIKVLDVETDPDVVVKVIRLEYATAEDIASLLNDLIGAASKDEGGAPAAKAEGEGDKSASRALSEYVERLAKTQADSGRKSKVGELSKDNIKILSDERTNALIIMASKGDLAAIEEIIEGMDRMLSQVLIEAVILEVTLDDSTETGVDWIQRSLIAYNEKEGGTLNPIAAFAGAGGGGGLAPRSGLTLTSPDDFPASPLAGLTYYATFFNVNVDVVLRALSTDNRTRLLSSPVILTTDNKKASITVATQRFFYKGKKYVGGGDNPFYEDDVERQEVGITLTVTPRINQKKFVVMEMEQEIENVSGSQTINDTEWPIVTTRKLQAEVAVQSGETIVMGGLVRNRDARSRSKVPILGDIPLLGIPFRSNRKEKGREEVIVFITPYVLNDPEEIMADATRRQKSLHAEGLWEHGWSDSKYAERPPAELRARREEGKDFGLERQGFERPMPVTEVELSEAMSPPAKATDPLENIDPEVWKTIREADKRWGKSLRRADRRVDGDEGAR